MTKLDVTTTRIRGVPARAAFTERYRKGAAAGGVDAARRRPRDAGVGHAEAQRRAAHELPAGIGGGRRRARPLLHHRHRPRRRLARVRRQGRDQPPAADRPRTPSRPTKLPTLESLRALLAQSRIELPPELPPIAAGVIGYMGYDTVRLIEHLPNQRPDALGVPDSVFVRPTIMVVFDAVKDEMIVVTPVYPRRRHRCAGGLCRTRWSACAASLPRSTSRCRTRPAMSGVAAGAAGARSPTPRPPNSWAWWSGPRSTSPPATSSRWCSSQRFSAPFTLPSVRALPRAAAHQPSPFLFYLDFGGFALVGSQPRDPGARARRRGDDPPARRHAPRAAPRPRRTRRSKPSCSPIPRSAPST